MLCIDSVSDIQIALSSVSAEDEDEMEGHTEREGRELPEGQQLLGKKIYVS